MAAKKKNVVAVAETGEITNETLKLARQRKEAYRAAQAASAEARQKRDELEKNPKTTQAKLAEAEEACKAAREAVKVAKEALIPLPKGRPTAEIAYTADEQKAMVELVRQYNLSTAVAILRAEKGEQAKLREEAGFPEALTVSSITVRKFVAMDPNPPELKRGRRKADAVAASDAKPTKGKKTAKADAKPVKGKGKAADAKPAKGKGKKAKPAAAVAVETPKEADEPAPVVEVPTEQPAPQEAVA